MKENLPDMQKKCRELTELLRNLETATAKTFAFTSFSKTATSYSTDIKTIIHELNSLRHDENYGETVRQSALKAKELSDKKVSPLIKVYSAQDANTVKELLARLESFIASFDNDTGKSPSKTASKKLSSIDGYIAYAEELIGSYEWKKSAGKSLNERLAKIKEKQNDKCVNISVVGEFNMGKSTFINALLRSEVMRSSYIEATGTGTTVVSTVIEYDEKPSLMIRKKNGQCRRMTYSNDEELRQDMAMYAANAKTAESISSLTLGYPVDMLKQGMRIIDTPGTGNTQQWHSETTIRTINEVSDASVILIDPTKVLPQTQINFIKDHLGDVIHQCIFVITKVDMLRAREIPEIIEYVKQKISYEFDIDEPFVITYASLNVLETAMGEAPANNRIQKLIDESYLNEERMYQYILKRKNMTQSNKLTLLLDDIYTSISENMNIISDEYRHEHELIEKTKQTDLSSFVNREKKTCISRFSDSSANIQYEIFEFTGYKAGEYKNEIISGLDGCSSKDSIRYFVDNTVASVCSDKARELHFIIRGRAQPMNQAALSAIHTFDESFKREYKRLGLMPIENNKIHAEFSSSDSDKVTVHTGSALSDVNLAISEENKTMGGGAAAGAIIGTFFGPGIGTVIGAAIGGWLFSPSIDTIRNRAKSSIESPIDNYFAEVTSREMNTLAEYSKSLEKSISDGIDRYFQNYNSFVQNVIQADERKQKEIDDKLGKLKSDMQKIDEYRSNLIKLRENLK